MGLMDNIGNSFDNFGNTLKGIGNEVSSAWEETKKEFKQTSIAGTNTDLTNQMVPRPKVLAEKILKSKTVSCSITLPDPIWTKNSITSNTITIPFYMTEDFGFSLGNTWKPMIDQENAMETFKFFLDSMSMFSEHTQVSLQSQMMSSVSWKGSTFSGFNLGNCLFVSTNRNIDPSELIYKLCLSCLPIKVKDFQGAEPPALKLGRTVAKAGASLVGGLANLFTLDNFKDAVDKGVQNSQEMLEDVGMVAPYGFGLTKENGSTVKPINGTTVTFNVGDWFCAGDLVIENIDGIKFSKELIAPARMDNTKSKNDLYDPTAQGTNYGYPLYASCSIKLKPYCMIDVSMFRKYFKTRNKMNVLNVNNLFNL